MSIPTDVKASIDKHLQAVRDNLSDKEEAVQNEILDGLRDHINEALTRGGKPEPPPPPTARAIASRLEAVRRANLPWPSTTLAEVENLPLEAELCEWLRLFTNANFRPDSARKVRAQSFLSPQERESQQPRTKRGESGDA